MSAPANANDGCVGPASEQAGKAGACAGCPNQSACASGAGRQPDPSLDLVAARLSGVKHKLLVISGKGGVGKSTVSAQLAFSLANRGFSVGLLDVDICGPSVPRMLSLTGRQVHQSASGWSPVYVDDNLGVMSIGFLLPNQDDAVIWRGPRKTALIKQLLTDVDWGALDYLIIDTPPGTSDEHISLIQSLKSTFVDGAVVVTTPQEVAMADVRKELNFCKKTGLHVLGVVENMSGLQAPLAALRVLDAEGSDETERLHALLREHAPDLLASAVACTDVFPPHGGGPQGMASQFGVPFLGRLPLDPRMTEATEAGEAFVVEGASSPAVAPFRAVVDGVVEAAAARAGVAAEAAEAADVAPPEAPEAPEE